MNFGKWALLISILSSGESLAGVDYTYCSDAIEKFSYLTPITLDKSGKLKVEIHQNDSYRIEENRHKIVTKFGKGDSSNRAEYEVILEDNRPSEFTATEFYQGVQRKRTLSFKILNDVCIPEKSYHEEKINGEVFKQNALVWNTEMCRELINFLDATPDALICNCGNDHTNRKLASIIKKYDPSYKESTGKVNLSEKGSGRDETIKFLARFARPISDSVDFVKSCDGEGAVRAALEDKRVWKKASNRGAGSEDAPKSSGGSVH